MASSFLSNEPILSTDIANNNTVSSPHLYSNVRQDGTLPNDDHQHRPTLFPADVLAFTRAAAAAATAKTDWTCSTLLEAAADEEKEANTNTPSLLPLKRQQQTVNHATNGVPPPEQGEEDGHLALTATANLLHAAVQPPDNRHGTTTTQPQTTDKSPPIDVSPNGNHHGTLLGAFYADDIQSSAAPIISIDSPNATQLGRRDAYMTAAAGGSTSSSDSSSGVSSANDSSAISALESARRLTEENLSASQDDHKSSHENGGHLRAVQAALQTSSSSGDSQRSHSSSLESLDDRQAVKRRSTAQSEEDENAGGTSTSCSVDSFEISSPGDTLTSDRTVKSFSDYGDDGGTGSMVAVATSTDGLPTVLSPLKEESPLRCSASSSVHSEVDRKAVSASVREKVDEQLAQLDTGLPQMDFSHFERQLEEAVKERETNQRKLISEGVRRRLAMEEADEENDDLAPVATVGRGRKAMANGGGRQTRSNLGHRLQKGMNLQMCFINDALMTSEEEEDDSEADDDGEMVAAVPRSRSTPIFAKQSSLNQQHHHSQPGTSSSSSAVSASAVNRSQSTLGDSAKRASELRRERQLQEQSESGGSRRQKLESETREMLLKAKQAAHMQMEVERQRVRQSASGPTLAEQIVGVPVGKKLSRLQLSKMGITQLQLIANELHIKIEKLNEELVQLLIERDGLHMEQDSMLVDIEDLIQHQKASTVRVPEFLVVAQPPNAKPGARFRIFKR